MALVEHFSHNHSSLILLCDGDNHSLEEEENKDDDDADDQAICSGCRLSVSGHSTTCTNTCTRQECKFFLHKSCAELPKKIITFFHQLHPLTLFETTFPYDYDDYDEDTEKPCEVCASCEEEIVLLGGFMYYYYCPVCSFPPVKLHITCALQHVFEPHGHKHTFMLRTPTPFFCDSCEDYGSGISYLCTTCQVQVHKSCTSFPLNVKIFGHDADDHQLTLTYRNQLDDNETMVARNCRICNALLMVFCFYHCASCSYFAHVHCALSPDLLLKLDHHEQDDDDDFLQKLIMKDENNQENLALTTTVVPDHDYKTTNVVNDIIIIISPDDKIPKKLEHFSHQHCLNLCNDESSDEICDGCTQPISSSPFYNCVKECPDQFFLHKECALLPNKILHPGHHHPLTLFAKPPWNKIDDTFTCSYCCVNCNGFVYACEQCKILVDVTCSLFVETLRHESHHHTLHLTVGYKYPQCTACGNPCKSYFTCFECMFCIDWQCASLPKQVMHECPKHEWNRHPFDLVMTTSSDDNINEVEEEIYYCDICEEPRRKNHWYYYCEDCEYSAHPTCIYGKYKIKFGRISKFPCHAHPLTLVEKPRGSRQLPCDTCGHPCKDQALVCSECNFNIHSKYECFK